MSHSSMKILHLQSARCEWGQQAEDVGWTTALITIGHSALRPTLTRDIFGFIARPECLGGGTDESEAEQVLLSSAAAVLRRIKECLQKLQAPLITSSMVVRRLVQVLFNQMHLHGTKQVAAAAASLFATNTI
ncbi:hypothetical protein MHYP_G00271990 [Metynnis hypsauchen]